MLINGRHTRTIWTDPDGAPRIIDQTRLPFAVETVRLETAAEAERAIADMQVRGAPLIGVTAAFSLALALGEDPSDAGLDAAVRRLAAARPTAVNLAWALERVRSQVQRMAPAARAGAAHAEAQA